MGPSFWRALALFLFLAQLGWPGSALANTRYAALVVNASTGEVLYSRKADQRRHPASLTKMMTLFMLFEALDRGDVKLSDQLAVSKHAYGQAPSKLGLKPGDKISVEDAILGLVTKSANDVAVVIAEALAPATSCCKLQLPAIMAGETLDGLAARACKGALITSKGRGGS